MTTAQDLLAVLQQFQRGTHTTDPNDPNYGNHWNIANPDTPITGQVVHGSVVKRTPVGKVKQQVNIRYTDDQVLLDTPAVSAVGPLARLAQKGLGAAGLQEPMVAPRPAGVAPGQGPFVVHTDSGPLEVRPNPAVHIGRASDLSPREQLSNTWHLLRGR